MRVRAVIHAGEVRYDANGCFGEALDIAFRLLDAPAVRKSLQTAVGPLALVVSGDIFHTIVRHGSDGIDKDAFRPLASIHIAGRRYTVRIHFPHEAAELHVAEIARYRQSA